VPCPKQVPTPEERPHSAGAWHTHGTPTLPQALPQPLQTLASACTARILRRTLSDATPGIVLELVGGVGHRAGDGN